MTFLTTLKPTTHSLLRRLAALFYDCLLVTAVVMLATSLWMLFTKGQAISSGNHYYQAYIVVIWFSFFVWFWSYRGQTLGMQAWKLRLINEDNQTVSPKQALLRLLLAIPSIGLGGIGLLWAFVDKQQLCLHDRLSKTRLVQH